MKYVKLFYVSDARVAVDLAQTGATAVANIINSNNYRLIANTLRTVASTLSSFLGGVSVLVNFVFTFLPTGPSIDQVVLEEMRAGFREVNSRLDSLKNDVESLRGHFAWALERYDLQSYLRHMNNLARDLNSLKQENASSSYLEMKKMEYRNYFENVYPGSRTIALFLINKSIYETYANSVNYDRRLVLNMTKTCMYYLAQLSELDLTCRIVLQDYNQHAIEMEKIYWDGIFREFQGNMLHVDNIVRDLWFSQAKEDITSFRLDKRNVDNGPFAIGLRDLLSEKYYWRDWVVVNYDKKAYGFDEHNMNENDPNVWLYLRDDDRPERNLVVASTSEISINLLHSVRSIGPEYNEAIGSELKSNCFEIYCDFSLCSANDTYDNERAKFLVDYIPTRLNPFTPSPLGVAFILVVESQYDAYNETDEPGRLYTKQDYEYCFKKFDVIVFPTLSIF